MIADFISQVRTRGLARTNRYEVIIPLPGSDEQNLARLFCEQVTLPGVSLATTPSRFYGDTREMPYERLFDPVSMTFYVDSAMKLKSAFDDWMSTIVNPTTRTIQYYRDYVRPVYITVLDVSEQPVHMVTLYEAYPKAIQAVNLESAGRDIMRLTVNMQYKYWEPLKIEQQPAVLSRESLSDRQGVVTGSGYTLSTILSNDQVQFFDTQPRGVV